MKQTPKETEDAINRGVGGGKGFVDSCIDSFFLLLLFCSCDTCGSL